MARGFDSKFVEAQQDEALREKTIRPALSAEQRENHARREALQLARARAASDLTRATATAHRRMLEDAIRSLDEQIGALDGR